MKSFIAGYMAGIEEERAKQKKGDRYDTGTEVKSRRNGLITERI